ncbi:hypothetical protein Landi51_00171 [Colletotrichum acutatum]
MILNTLFLLAGTVASLSTSPTFPHHENPEAISCSTSASQVTPTWHQQQIFETFIQRFFVQKDVKGAILDNMSVNYTQHNPNALSGRQNAIDYVGPIFDAANFTILRHSFSNNTGWVHTKMEIPGLPLTVVVDIFRFQGSCIVEHWDVATTMSPNATNPLALF